jgi:hypothetical protein
VLFQAGLALAANDQRYFVLQTVPVRREGIFYVPTRAAVEALGGSLEVLDEGIAINCNGRRTVVPKAYGPNITGEGMDRFICDLYDPRVPVEEYQEAIRFGDKLREGLNLFNCVAQPASLALEGAIASGRLAEMLGRHPYGEQFTPLAEAAVQAIADALMSFNNLVEEDEAKAAPIRRALQGAYDVTQNPTGDAILRARPDWEAVPSAVSLQLTDNADTRTKVQRMCLALSALINYLGSGGDEMVQIMAEAENELIAMANNMALSILDAQKWHLQTYNSYFPQLCDDSRLASAGWRPSANEPCLPSPPQTERSYSVLVANVGTITADLSNLQKLTDPRAEEAVHVRIKALDPDIVVLLEVRDQSQADSLLSDAEYNTDQYIQAEDSAYQLFGGNWDVICVKRDIMEARHFEQFKKTGTETLGVPDDHTGYVVFALKGTSTRIQLFYNHPPSGFPHPELNMAERIEMTSWIVQNQIGGLPCLVMGDFNVDFMRSDHIDADTIRQLLIERNGFAILNPTTGLSGSTPIYYDTTELWGTLDWVLKKNGVYMSPGFGDTFELEFNSGPFLAYSPVGVNEFFDHLALYGEVVFR